MHDVVLSTIHQQLVLWNEERYVEHVKADEFIYKGANAGILNTHKLLKSLNLHMEFK